MAALRTCWPETRIQRCLVHVQRNIRTHITANPRTDAGKALRKLSLDLTRVKTPEQAAAWLVGLNAWHQLYAPLIEAKTYASDPGAIRPTWARANSTWWWTHGRLRKAYNLLAVLVKRGHLFTFLDPDFMDLGIASTTNHIEGGTNAQIKDLLRRHRGMPSPHQRRAVDWWCYLHSPAPKPPSTLIRPEHWTPTQPTTTKHDDEQTPGGWGTTPTAEEGLWVRKGWAGRS
jgi:hypothetical protein